MVLADVVHISSTVSLGVVVATLVGAVATSMVADRRRPQLSSS
jgi:hypothetical protein